MRKLEEIQREFEMMKNSQKSKKVKNESYVKLMNELERDYHTFIINGNTNELDKTEIKLYQEISAERIF